MNTEMAELRKILDLFEGAGFTVTYLQADYLSRRFKIAIKSSSITEIDQFEHETATAGRVIYLAEKNWYRVLNYCADIDEVLIKYEGTIYLEIVRIEKAI
jgi:hypothetical protein